MKYSLRSLMIVVTLVCLALGAWAGRVEHLRRWAVFHEREAERHSLEYGQVAELKTMIWHGRMAYYNELRARQFRDAIYRPWMIVGETRSIKEIPHEHLRVETILKPEPAP